MHSLLKSSRELFGTMQLKLAHSLDDMLGALPDSSERDRTIRKYLSKHAPCEVPDCYWSLINVVDYNFHGYDSQHFYSDEATRAHTQASVYTPSMYVIRNMALAAKLAYEDPPVFKYIANLWKMTTDDMFFIDYQDTQAFIMYDDQNIILSFRGTEFINPKDWQTDVKMKLMDVTPRQRVMSDGLECKVDNVPMAHTGFLEALGLQDEHTTHDYLLERNDDPYSKIHHILSVLQIGTQRRIYVTGHSLGAALASVFVAQLLLEKDPLVSENFGGVYTYGQPRTGNAAYCDLFAGLERQGRVVRVVNQKDIVTHVPLVTVGYAHHGNKIHIDHKCDIHYTRFKYEQLPPDFNRRDKKNQTTRTIAYSKERGIFHHGKRESLLHTTVFALMPGAMEDHYPSDYVSHLEKSMDN